MERKQLRRRQHLAAAIITSTNTNRPAPTSLPAGRSGNCQWLQLVFSAFFTGIIESAARAAGTIAWLVEKFPAAFRASSCRSPVSPAARMETAQIIHRTSQATIGALTGSRLHQMRNHAPAAAVVWTTKSQYQRPREGGQGTQKPQVTSLGKTFIPAICLYYSLILCCLSFLIFPASALDTYAGEQILVFDKIGKIACG
jgi:hypothetical protein